MNSGLRRLNPTISMVALLVSLLALVASAAGAGYAAATIGTQQLKNNAVTAKKIKKNAVTTKKIKKNAVTGDKVKDGSLTAVELVPNEVQKKPTFGNGGEGDCVWQSAATLLPGLGAPTFRKDRFGTVHLAGVAVASNGVGGDLDCDNSDPGQFSDSVIFTLPAGYIPAQSYVTSDGVSTLIVAGASGISSGGQNLLPGQVGAPTALGAPVILDGISFEPVGSNVVTPRVAASSAGNVDLFEWLSGH